MRPVVDHPYFDAFIVFAIIGAAVIVGLQTDEELMCEVNGK